MLKRINLLLFGIILMAAILRFGGIYYSHPPYHADEGMSYAQGIAIVQENALDVRGYSIPYNYPNVVPLLNAILFKNIFIPIAWVNFWIANLGNVIDGIIKVPLGIHDYKRIFQIDILGQREINVLRWGRIIAASIGVVGVLATYLLARNLFGKVVGLIAAFLLAINYRQVLNSHINLPDIYSALFLTLSLYFSWRIYEQPTKKNYLLAGIFSGIYVSTKFHIYSVFPLLLVHIFATFKNGFRFSAVNNIKKLIDPKIVLAILVLLTTFIVLNPFHLINLSETLHLVNESAKKYASGRFSLHYYSYWYLYNIGLGKVISIFVLVGVLLSLIFNFRKSIFLLSAITPFLFVLTFYSAGGFYTRNFVTTTPLLVIFAAYTFFKLSALFKSKISIIILFLLLVAGSVENMSKSVILVSEYSKPWNYTSLVAWLNTNLPTGSKVSAHPSVPLPLNETTHNSYDFNTSFSIEEFKADGSDFAIMNTEWSTNDFYGWMGDGKLFTKPVVKMENTYPALAILELSDFSVYKVEKSWLAPDSNFLVAKVPNFKYEKREGIANFENSDNAIFNVKGLEGLVVEYDIKTTSKSMNRDGYLYIKFYQNQQDASDDVNHVAVRLSARNMPHGVWVKKTLATNIPDNSLYVRIDGGVYNPAISKIELRNIKVYNAHVEFESSLKVSPTRIDENIIFPNSHGNL